jgi:hypothetical protein
MHQKGKVLHSWFSATHWQPQIEEGHSLNFTTKDSNKDLSLLIIRLSGVIHDLAKSTLSLVAQANVSRILLRKSSSLCEALITNIVSSTYCIIGNPAPSLEGIGNWKRPY